MQKVEWSIDTIVNKTDPQKIASSWIMDPLIER